MFIKALVPGECQDVIGSTTVRRSIMWRTAAWGTATTCPMSQSRIFCVREEWKNLLQFGSPFSLYDLESVDWCCLPRRRQQRLSRKGSLIMVLLMGCTFGSAQVFSRATSGFPSRVLYQQSLDCPVLHVMVYLWKVYARGILMR
jgi:hypothetical protein